MVLDQSTESSQTDMISNRSMLYIWSTDCYAVIIVLKFIFIYLVEGRIILNVSPTDLQVAFVIISSSSNRKISTNKPDSELLLKFWFWFAH